MRDLRGIIVDIKKEKDTVIVLTPEGDVREVITNGQQFQLGDHILFYEKMVEPQKENQLSRRALRYATATAAAVLLFSLSPLHISDIHLGNLARSKNVSLGGPVKNVAYAESSVYIESKSNVKVGLKDQKVVSANALNQPAQIVLKEMSWNSNDSIDEFMQSYFEEAEESGYLNPGEPVVISVDAPVPGSEKDALLKKIETVSKKHHVKVVAVAVPDEVVKKAKELGVTPGKLVISLAVKASTGQAIPLDTLKTATVAELVNTAPNAVETLSTITEDKLAQLVRNEFVVSAPVDNQPTETANTEIMPTSSEPETTTASNTATENTATDVDNDTQATDTTVADSTTNQPESVNCTVGSGSSEQPQAQPEYQPQEEPDPATVNDEQKPEPQTQEGQTQDEQTQVSQQPQDNQTQESQTQEGQNQEEQAPEQEQESQQQQQDQQQDNQAQDDQAQQGEHKQDKQPVNDDEQDKVQDKQHNEQGKTQDKRHARIHLEDNRRIKINHLRRIKDVLISRVGR